MTRRVAHTASFLQTFHTGQTTAARREAAGAIGSEPQPVAADAAAVAFVRTGRPAQFAQPTASANYTAEYSGITVTHGNGLITEAQAKFVTDIATTREGVTEAMLESLKARLLQGFAKSAASAFITSYKDMPRKAAPAPVATTEGTEVPAGRYALRVDGVVKFYRLDRPTEGKWAGYTFLKAQASDELYPIRNRAEKERIIAEIGRDIQAAATLYGVELGRCYECGRKLTDETSRALGIGPDCRSK